ncbi:hypothetical protein Nepgr_019845 [Nepenthes gracilis]|uniref:DUF4005 domain-containing protein n=1 Tax=Nepenthes gracilis TaxID=150966 RepID=A0AAD3SWJ5_NEPGR|nr:hypothetical protein Nepgr_019845 [Nepenthes gracilis]
MGRPTAFCFKIIACGSDSADQDGVENSEAKASDDKGGWSFRKRSVRHQVLSNSVISEAPTSGSKETQEAVSTNFQAATNSTVPKRNTTQPQLDEKLQLTSVESKISETTVATKNGCDAGVVMDEHAALVIQTAVRGFLAQREIARLISIIKLQAAIRGHLVRRHAVGTLYCIQAIVKVQALVRARRLKLLDKEISTTKPVVPEQSSIEKLFRNGFARQLLESTPRANSMNIKCDPSRPNSAWSWLERWMSVSSSKPSELQKQDLNLSQEEQQIGKIFYQIEAEIPSEVPPESAYSKSGLEEAVKLFESGKNSDSFVADEQPSPPDSAFHEAAASEEINMSSSLPVKPFEEREHPKHSTKRSAMEQLNSQGNKFVHGSRKASNPAFVIAHPKFEELNSATNSGRSSGVSHQDIGMESHVDRPFSGAQGVVSEDPSKAEISAPHDSRIHHGGSECGTELSITSTLDSLDTSKIKIADVGQDLKVMEERSCDPENINSTDFVGNGIQNISVSDLSSSTSIQQEEFRDTNGYSTDPIVAFNTPIVEQKPEKSESNGMTNGERAYSSTNQSSLQQSERNATNVQIELCSETEQSNASPKSHTTVPESQETPSSQVSVKTRRNKIDKIGSNPKRVSLSACKRSASGVEQSSKDPKSGKRRTSFEPTKSNHVDEEQRDSSSSSSLPSYMQATKSALAKAHSPRSSPDVRDKELCIKKRHSLPGPSGREESPRIQRSMSQAPPGSKGNGTQERWHM